MTDDLDIPRCHWPLSTCLFEQYFYILQLDRETREVPEIGLRSALTTPPVPQVGQV